MHRGLANGVPLRTLAQRSWSGAESTPQCGREGVDGKWQVRAVDVVHEPDFQLSVTKDDVHTWSKTVRVERSDIHRLGIEREPKIVLDGIGDIMNASYIGVCIDNS